MAFNVANNTTSCQFFPLVFSLDDISLRLVLQQRLFLALCNSTSQVTVEDCAVQNSLYRLKHLSRIVYRWAIAFKLQKQSELPPAQLALYLSSLLSSNILPKENPVKQEISVTVTVVEPGWLDFSICDRTLAPWLDHLVFSLPPLALPLTEEKRKINFFPLQYAHARCCSLLRLAARQNLIKLKNEELSQGIGQWLEPARIPWLDHNQQWQLIHPAEKHLLYKLIDTIDLLSSHSSENWYQVTKEVSKAVLDFEACCRIFGRVQKETPWLAQARLGLIGVTQLLLYKLLTKLGSLPLIDL